MKSLVLVALLSLTGCATTAPQTEALLRGPGRNPIQAHVKNVPFIEQAAGHCGPASLAMAMAWSGKLVEVDRLAEMMLTGSKGGSLQEAMIAAGRREAMMVVEISGFDRLLAEISSGHPVIVFENLGLSWYPQWHYAVAIGFDLDRKEIELHSGPDAHLRTDLRVFERSWKHSNYWAVVVLPPGKIARSADELGNLRAAAGIELALDIDAAQASYEAVLGSWPKSMGARIGLANLAYKRGDYDLAVRHLRQALREHPESAQVKHNLEIAERAARREK